MKAKRSLFCWTSHALVVFAIFAVVSGCKESPSRAVTGPRITSYDHLYHIGIAVRDYKNEHGQLPLQLSDLVPHNILSNQLALFYVNGRGTRDQFLPSDWNINPKQIDRYSAYVYLGTNSGQGIIAFEKTNLWKSTTAQAGKLAVLFSDFHVQYVPIGKVFEVIGTGIETNSTRQP